MNREILIGYQLLTGISDAATGALLILTPAFTLQHMGVSVPADALAFISFIGAFVLSVGLACLYGARVAIRRSSPCRLETVWLLTAITRCSVAVFITVQILGRTLEPAWLTVALADSACVVYQAVGLRKGWVGHVAR